MERQDLDRQDKFFAMILSEAVPDVPDALDAAYIERLEENPEESRYTAFAATLVGGVLRLHRLLSKGYKRLDGEERHIKTSVIPLTEVRTIEVETDVTGFGAETFRGTFHLHDPLEGWETPIQLPLKGPGKVHEQRHGMTAKSFTSAVVDALSSIQPKGGRG